MKNEFFLLVVFLVKWIFLEIAIFDVIFDISSLGFTISSKNLLPSNFVCSLRKQNTLLLNFLFYALGPKHLSFEIVWLLILWLIHFFLGMVLFPLNFSETPCSHSILLLRIKLIYPFFIVNYMIKVSLDPSSLSYGLIITCILEACDMSLKVVPSVSVKKCYNFW